MIKKTIQKKTKLVAKKAVKKSVVAKPAVIKAIQPKVLYEDADILAVDKPAGLIVHADGKDHGGKKEKTLSDWLVKKFPDAREVGEVMEIDGEPVDRSGIVHRLDKETSGVILLAKTSEGFQCLKEQFQNHEVKKTYHTFVVGTPKHPRGIIDNHIGKSGTDFRARSAGRAARGHTREAETQYMVKSTATVGPNKYSLVQAMPKTGRTHQIRVHMKVIGHPVVADALYGVSRNTLGFKRTALHSFSVQFQNCAGEMVKVEAPYPADFQYAVKKMGTIA